MVFRKKRGEHYFFLTPTLYATGKEGYYPVLDEEYRLKLDALYTHINSDGTNYTSAQQDFLDSFFDIEGDLAIAPSDWHKWQKDKIIELWNAKIREDR